MVLIFGPDSLQRPVENVGSDEEPDRSARTSRGYGESDIHGSKLVVFLESVVEDSVGAVGSIVKADTERLRLRDNRQVGADICVLGHGALLGNVVSDGGLDECAVLTRYVHQQSGSEVLYVGVKAEKSPARVPLGTIEGNFAFTVSLIDLNRVAASLSSGTRPAVCQMAGNWAYTEISGCYPVALANKPWHPALVGTSSRRTLQRGLRRAQSCDRAERMALTGRVDTRLPLADQLAAAHHPQVPPADFMASAASASVDERKRERGQDQCRSRCRHHFEDLELLRVACGCLLLSDTIIPQPSQSQSPLGSERKVFVVAIYQRQQSNSAYSPGSTRFLSARGGARSIYFISSSATLSLKRPRDPIKSHTRSRTATRQPPHRQPAASGRGIRGSKRVRSDSSRDPDRFGTPADASERAAISGQR